MIVSYLGASEIFTISITHTAVPYVYAGSRAILRENYIADYLSRVFIRERLPHDATHTERYNEPFVRRTPPMMVLHHASTLALKYASASKSAPRRSPIDRPARRVVAPARFFSICYFGSSVVFTTRPLLHREHVRARAGTYAGFAVYIYRR